MMSTADTKMYAVVNMFLKRDITIGVYELALRLPSSFQRLHGNDVDDATKGCKNLASNEHTCVLLSFWGGSFSA